MRRVLLLVALLLVASASGVARAETSQVPKGHIGIRLLDPGTSTDPRAGIYIVGDLEPGNVIQRRIEVQSGLDRAVTVSLYAGGASETEGEIAFMEGRARNDLATWTTVSPSKLRVPAGGAATATVTITMPNGVTGGDRVAVVWAEAPRSTSNGVTEINRVGVRAYVSSDASRAPLFGAANRGRWTLLTTIGLLALLLAATATAFAERRRRVRGRFAPAT